jgi:hypothetical protein
LSSNLKLNEQMVCVHIIEDEREDGHEAPIPDMRANKPLGVHAQEDNKTAFFQKLIHAKIDQKKLVLQLPMRFHCHLVYPLNLRIMLIFCGRLLKKMPRILNTHCLIPT